MSNENVTKTNEVTETAATPWVKGMVDPVTGERVKRPYHHKPKPDGVATTEATPATKSTTKTKSTDTKTKSATAYTSTTERVKRPYNRKPKPGDTVVTPDTDTTATTNTESTDTDAIGNPGDVEKEKIRALVSTMYNLQKLRIQTGNRLVASYKGLAEKSKARTEESVKAEIAEQAKRKETEEELELELEVSDIDPTSPEDDTELEKKRRAEEKEKKRILGIIVKEFTRITDAYAKDGMKKSENSLRKAIDAANGEVTLQYLKNTYDYEMAKTYIDLLNTEMNTSSVIAKQVKNHPMWAAFFDGVSGCGPLQSAVCLCYFDVHKARHPSSFWKYAGLDVSDGIGRNKSMKVEQTYISKKGTTETKLGLGYNPILKSKLVGVLGPCLIKCNTNKDEGTCKGYALAYYDYKNRLENRVDADKLTPKHRHNMAMRYMVKQFVRDMWVAWRTLEGYDIGLSYEEEFLGRKHHGYNEAVEGKWNTRNAATK